MGLQKLGADFYEQEHSKPLFNENSLLTIYHLYRYYCLLELFKIIKLRMPISLYSLFKFNKSQRHKNNFKPSVQPSTSFVYQSSFIWNSCHKLSNINDGYIDFFSSILYVKIKLKEAFLKAQRLLDQVCWSIPNLDLSQVIF